MAIARASPGDVMAMIALVAVDLIVGRNRVSVPGSILGLRSASCDVGLLPLAPLLAVLAYRRLVGPGRVGPFALGFEAAGLAGIALFVGCVWWFPAPLDGPTEIVFDLASFGAPPGRWDGVILVALEAGVFSARMMVLGFSDGLVGLCVVAWRGRGRGMSTVPA